MAQNRKDEDADDGIKQNAALYLQARRLRACARGARAWKTPTPRSTTARSG